jgi:hypothetical protein
MGDTASPPNSLKALSCPVLGDLAKDLLRKRDGDE